MSAYVNKHFRNFAEFSGITIPVSWHSSPLKFCVLVDIPNLTPICFGAEKHISNGFYCGYSFQLGKKLTVEYWMFWVWASNPKDILDWRGSCSYWRHLMRSWKWKMSIHWHSLQRKCRRSQRMMLVCLHPSSRSGTQSQLQFLHASYTLCTGKSW